MQNNNYLEQARSFLSQNGQRLALRVVPMALIAVAVAHAQPTFNAPSSTLISVNSGCSGGSASGSLTGAATGGGSGLTLSGNASTGSFYSSSCTLNLNWQGTGSGTFNESLAKIGSTVTPSFTITPSVANINSYTLTVYINGVLQDSTTCTTGCSGSITLSSQSFSSPSTVTLSTWQVNLAVNASPTDVFGTVTVNVPGGSSIDITTGSSSVPTVPALSSAALAVTALMLLGLAAYKIVGWKPAGGQPS